MSETHFKYHVRVSPKGRTVRLRVTVQGGLEVIIPRGCDESKIPGLLERKKHWVSAALERADENRKFFEPEPVWRLPMQIKQ
jgi:predicted metal-dependent hydrolase